MMGTFTKNTLITFITRVLMLIFGIGISIIIARVLGPERQGIYSLAILSSSLLIIFTNFGIGASSVYYLGKRKYSPKEIFGNNILYTLFISIFAILMGLIIIFFFNDKLFPNIEKEYLFLALSLIPFQLFLDFIVSILLGFQKIKKYNLINLFQIFIFLILIGILLLGFHLGIKAAIFAQIMSFFIGGVLLFFCVRRETGGISLKLNKSYFKDSFLYGGKVCLNNILSFLHFRLNIFLINIFINPVAVGFYSIAVGISEKLWLVSQSASTVLFPKVSSETNEKKLKEFTPFVCRNVLFITIIGAVLLFFLSDWIIILLYSKAYLNSILPLKILLIGMIGISGDRILVNDLTGRGKPMIGAYINGGVVILNLILNILWIPKFGIAGAAWATAISYVFDFVVTLVIYSKISNNKIKDSLFLKKSDLIFYKQILKHLTFKTE